MKKLTVLNVGKSHCISAAIRRSKHLNKLYVVNATTSPGLEEAADDVIIGDTKDPKFVAENAKRLGVDLAIIGSEEPLSKGVVDALNSVGVRCVGPTKNLAKLESSKSFTRKLLSDHEIPGNPEYRVFSSMDGLPEYLESLTEFVVKPDGLTGGKGVQVFGDHFNTSAAAADYCRQLFENGEPVVIIEEKLDGEEFSFQSFWDGHHIAHTIPVQDHKRAFPDDTGPNTGGMGSYSCSNHLLPFLTSEQIAEAGRINTLVGEALLKETGQEFKGILYGGFMLTKSGLRVIEYNARFGDPEVMNVLTLLKTDFLEICQSIVDGTLDKLHVEFANQATVCKYVVPEGYPVNSKDAVGSAIDLSGALNSAELNKRLRMYYAAVDSAGGQIRLTDSRSVAFVGIGETLAEAERIAEAAAASVKGRVFHRSDIGTPKLIQKRIDHMERIWDSESKAKRRFA